jgi:hypothetical protein
MSGFRLNASTPRKTTEANRKAYGRQLCTPSVFAYEASRTAGKDAYTLVALDRCGLTTLQSPGVRRAHKGVATTADHIWIARNRGKFIPIARDDWTQPVLAGVVRQ